MSVGMVIRLANGTRLSDTRRALQKLTGADINIRPASTMLGDTDHVMLEINIHHPEGKNSIDGVSYRYATYHEDGGDDAHVREISVSVSSSYWAALGRALVDFFGGDVDYNDSDRVDVDFQKRPSHQYRGADDRGYERVQRALLALQPLTEEDVRAFDDTGVAYSVDAMKQREKDRFQ